MPVGDADEHRRALASICRVFVATAPVDGAAFIAMTSDQARVALCASDDTITSVEQIEYSLGEGPIRDAFGSGRAVLVSDFLDSGTAARWPVFAEQTADLPIGALVAIPMQLGAVTTGVCVAYRSRVGPISPTELERLLRAIDAAHLALLALRAGSNGTEDESDVLDAILLRVVHQATGMLVAQLGLGVEDAFSRLRAHAYATGRTLRDVADDIVARRVRLEPDPPRPIPPG